MYMENKKEIYSKIPPNIILWGGTGQAKVVKPILDYYGVNILAVFDDTPSLPTPLLGIPIYYGKDGFRKWRKENVSIEFGFCIAIGNPHGAVRMALSKFLIEEGGEPINVIHPDSSISPNLIFGKGIQVMAGAIIAPEVKIGEQCIINTKASVDHECILGNGVEISPGATLCGCINVESRVWVGAGATILPRLNIGEDSIIGSGAVVTENVPAGVTVVGVPAKKINKGNIYE